MEFSSRLKELREAKNLTQPELAKILKVGKTTISNWENGRRIPDQSMMINISNYFGVTVDSLIKGVNSDTSDTREVTIGDLAKDIIDKLQQIDFLRPDNIDDEHIWTVIKNKVREELRKTENLKGDANK